MFAPVLLAAAVTLSPPGPPPLARPVAPPARDAGSAAFAADLCRAAAAADPAKSLLISPESVRAALALAHAGADGETAAELAAALRIPTGPDGRANHAAVGRLLNGLNVPPAGAGGAASDGVTVAPANTIFVDDGVTLSRAYQAAARIGFGAEPQPAPFTADPAAAAAAINGWVKNRTAGKIPRIVNAGSVRNAPLALVNALYVKAPWADGFKDWNTGDAPFTRDDGTTAPVPLMHRRDDLPLTIARDGAEAVRLDYVGGRLAFTAILPPKGTTLAEFDRGLTPQRLAGLLADGGERDTKLFLPRFKLDTRIGLGDALQTVGVRRAFTNAAQFGAMQAPGAGPPLKIGAVVHAALIEVEEKGTEAAAATVVAFAGDSAPDELPPPPPPPHLFRADRPFLFALHDVQTGAVLFLGRYAGP